MKNNKKFILKHRYIYVFYFLISTFFLQQVNAQSLYIAYQDDLGARHKIWGLTYVPSINDWRNEMNYYFHYEIYFYYFKLFEVASLDYASTSLVPMSSLSEYDIKTPEQLELELNGWTNEQRRIYFKDLDHIYIVELYPSTSQARIVEVRLNIQEE